jgi:predicted DCC family thiol-disulfide oxidoreductase YuxK
VQWILHHERSHVLRFAALNSPAGQALRAASHVGDDVDSLVWVEALSDGTVHARVWSDAVLAVISYVGGPWRGLGVLFVLPRGLRDAAYRLFARYRLKLAARSCLVPSFEERSRFLGA